MSGNGTAMRPVICCWSNGDADAFESRVPLLFAGRRNIELGFSNDVDILFLEGHDLLSAEYQSRLAECGYTLHDVSGLYGEANRRYATLNRFTDYEKKCYLRWPVMFSFFAGAPLIHYDADIVFNEDPAAISRLLTGRTFVLQGCPALTCISDRAWWGQYLNELDRFAADIDGYCAAAWIERQGWKESERTKWAGSRSRELMAHDQDFISHLIHTDRLVQDAPQTILRDLQGYFVFENPLYMHGYGNDLRRARYVRRAGIDYIDDRRPLIWHMQADFNRYLSRYIFARRYLPIGRRRIENDLSRKDLATKLYEFYVRRLRGDLHLRLRVYEYFFRDHDFSGVLNDRTWWKEGAFA